MCDLSICTECGGEFPEDQLDYDSLCPACRAAWLDTEAIFEADSWHEYLYEHPREARYLASLDRADDLSDERNEHE